MIDGVQTIIYSVKGNVAQAAIVNDDLTLQECWVAKSGNYFAHGETMRDAVRDATNKATKAMPVEEKVAKFNLEFPDPNVKIPAKRLFEWHYTLTGSCDLGRKSFMQQRGISMDDSFTVLEFIEITKDHYGGDVIKMLRPDLSRPD
jgi:hypothetical protein